MEQITPQEMPYADEIEFKQGFIERYKQLTDYNKFRQASLTFLRRSIRVNTLKISVAKLKRQLEKDWILQPIPWCDEGFWIEHRGEEKRRDVGNLKQHALGYFYLQEAASMIPPVILQPKPGEEVLDMCASPGSKSTQMAAMMQNKGLLISNDYQGDRLKPLSLNIQRMGILNCVITLMDGVRFRKTNQMFDKILLDAPCSGTGTICKSLKTIKIWNPNMITKLARTQKQLIEAAFKILKPGGTLVYSTCSVEPEENEGVVSHLLSNYHNAQTMPIDIGLNRGPAINEFGKETYHEGVRNSLRLWPQDNNTEGFFVSKIVKSDK